AEAGAVVADADGVAATTVAIPDDATAESLEATALGAGSARTLAASVAVDADDSDGGSDDGSDDGTDDGTDDPGTDDGSGDADDSDGSGDSNGSDGSGGADGADGADGS